MKVNDEIKKYCEKAFLRAERSKHNFNLKLQIIFEINIIRNEILMQFFEHQFLTTVGTSSEEMLTMPSYHLDYIGIVNEFTFGHIKKCEYMNQVHQKNQCFNFEFCSN